MSEEKKYRIKFGEGNISYFTNVVVRGKLISTAVRKVVVTPVSHTVTSKRISKPGELEKEAKKEQVNSGSLYKTLSVLNNLPPEYNPEIESPQTIEAYIPQTQQAPKEYHPDTDAELELQGLKPSSPVVDYWETFNRMSEIVKSGVKIREETQVMSEATQDASQGIPLVGLSKLTEEKKELPPLGIVELAGDGSMVYA